MKNPSPSTASSRPSTTTRALGFRPGDEARDPLERVAGDERAHLDAGLGAVADRDRRHPFGDLRDERIGDVADRDDDRDRHAALPRRAVTGRDRGVRR